MATFVLTFALFCLAVLGMALGVIGGRQPLKGGCGGSDCADRQGIGCAVCGNRPDRAP
jgi:hypothetical protein